MTTIITSEVDQFIVTKLSVGYYIFMETNCLHVGPILLDMLLPKEIYNMVYLNQLVTNTMDMINMINYRIINLINLKIFSTVSCRKRRNSYLYNRSNEYNHKLSFIISEYLKKPSPHSFEDMELYAKSYISKK